jgi:phosphoglycerate dehydrogenase-like enzyme
MAILHMLALARDVPRLVRHKAEARWEKFNQPLLHGKIVAIVGTGVIGRVPARRCKGLGMTVIGVTASPRALPDFDQVAGRDALEDIAAAADFLVPLTPLSPSTRGIVGARVLAAMKPSAFVVNLGRGELCDEDSLLAALSEKRIAGAGLDVFRIEPLPPDHPFWQMDNIFITPHMGGESDSYPGLAFPILQSNVACFLERRWEDMANRVAR